MSSAWWIVLAMTLSMGQKMPASSPLNAVQAFLEEQRIERVLRDTPLTVDFQDTPLYLAIHHISEELGLSFRLDEDELAEEGIALDRPIALKLENISAKSTLHVLLHQVHLRWVIEDAQIVVTTERSTLNKRVLRDYPIDDLLIAEADYLEERSCEKLMWVIVSTIAPNDWDETGGTGRIDWDRESRVLTVCQPLEVQEEVEQLLEALRCLRATSPWILH